MARIAPQVWHVKRTGSRSGVSRTGVWCWLGNDIAWMAHGINESLAPLCVSSAALITLDLLLLWQVKAHREITLHETSGLAWLATMIAVATVATGLLPAALLAASVAGTVPHAVASVRNEDLSGISPATWKLAGLDGILWLGYGTYVEDAPVTIYATLTLVCSIIILTRVAAHRRRTQQRRSVALP